MTEYPIARAREPRTGIYPMASPRRRPFPLLAMAWPKGAYRAGAGGAAECHFPDNAGKAYHNDKEEIGKQKGAAAVFGDSGGKHPYIAHSNGGTDAGQDKSPICFPGIPLSVS